MAREGMIFTKESRILEKTTHFYSLHLIFSCYYCSIDLKRQSKNLGLRPDKNSLVVPTFDT